MNTLPTAEEFFDSANIGVSNDTEYVYCQKDVVKKAKEFAKMHVEAALKTASENVYVELDEHDMEYIVNKKSILNSYSLDNIK